MSSSTDKKMDDLITYIVHNYPGESLTRTKLVKLAFLADALANEELGSKISNTNYIYYHYGPYSDELMNAVDRLDGKKINEKAMNAEVGKFYLYEPRRIADEEDQENMLSETERELVDEVLSDYAGYDTEDLIEYVYDEFEIEDKKKYSQLL